MLLKQSNIVILTILLFAYSSCTKEKFVPYPEEEPSKAIALFSMNKEIIAINEEISFLNQSSNANRYEWDLANGQFTSTINASGRYASAGTYFVFLKAFDSDNKPKQYHRLVKVGQNVITKTIIKRLSVNNAAGLPWDNDGTGPDLEINYTYPPSNQIEYPRTSIYNFSFNFPFESSMKNYPDNGSIFRYAIKDQNIEIRLVEKDSITSEQIIGTWILNPYNLTRDPITGTSSIILQNNECEIGITFTLL